MRRNRAILFAVLVVVLITTIWWGRRLEIPASPGNEPPAVAGIIRTSGVPAVDTVPGDPGAEPSHGADASGLALWTLAAPATSAVAGDPAVLPFATADAATLLNLNGLQPGAEIVIPLPGSSPTRGRVNLVLRDADGMVRVGGELIGGRAGGFSFGGRGAVTAGRILMPAESRAYVISTPADERLLVQEKPLAEVICFPLPPEPEGALAIPAEAPPLGAPPLLSSRPAAVAVLYLDFDGETVVDPGWNGGFAIVAAPAVLNHSQITEVWNRVKEDFLPFNIDVTTDPSRYASAPVGRRMRCIITPTSAWFGAVGGVGYVNSFREAGAGGFSPTVPCWVFNSGVSSIAEAISHEFGHTLGLEHDGRTNPREEYYYGHGTGALGWAPIMGVGYFQPLVQWSKGEYANANNHEDDVAIIAGGANGFGYAPDEAGGARSTAANLSISDGVFVQAGVISSANDVDYFVFPGGAPNLSLVVEAAPLAPNVDLLLTLEDGNGNVLASANPDQVLSASLGFATSPGTYFVRVQGTGRGAVGGTGYSNYGSIGAYTLTGVLTDPPEIQSPPANQTAALGGTASFTVTASGPGTLTYRWRKNGVALVDGGGVSGAATATLTLTGIQVNDAGKYSVAVTSVLGTAISAPATLSIIGAPVIVGPPLSQVSVAGQPVSFQVSAVSETSPTYQWLRNGVPIAGATNASLDLASVAVADRGWYDVVVANALGTARSRFRFNVVPENCTVVAWGQNTSGQSDVPTGTGRIVAVEAGTTHSLALKADGTVLAWGRDSSGQVTMPPGLSNVVAISGGSRHSLALRADGTVVAWGDNTQGQTNTPTDLRNVVAISAGYEHSMALKTDGTVVTWGGHSSASPVPEGVSDVVEIAGGAQHSVALKADGTVVAWGTNLAASTVPAGLASVIGVSTSSHFTLALKQNGTVAVWGSHLVYAVPAGLTTATMVSAGPSHGVALKSDGSVLAWGYDFPELAAIPVEVANVAAVSARGEHYLALLPAVGASIVNHPTGETVAPGSTVTLSVTASGTPKFGYQWKRNGVALMNGPNISGATSPTLIVTNVQPGDSGSYSVLVSNAGGDVTSNPAVLAVAAPPSILTRPLSRVISIHDAVAFTAMASGVEPLTYGWKHNGQAVAGANTATLFIPDASVADRGWYQLTVTGADGGQAASVFHLTVSNRPTNGPLTVRGWGANDYGQITIPAGLNDLVAVSGGEHHSLALRANGTVVAWGQSPSYFGVGTVPPGLTGVVAVSAGASHNLALKADGTVVAWGSYQLGNVTVPTTLRNVVAVTAGAHRSYALKSDGSVVAWGDGASGQPASGIFAIAAGGAHVLAIRADGRVIAWGQNSGGQTIVPAGLDDVVDVAAEHEHSLALKSNGTVVGWGTSFDDVQIVPAGLANVESISTGRNTGMALRADGTVVAWGSDFAGQSSGAASLTDVIAISSGYHHGLALVPVLPVPPPPAPAIFTGPSSQLVNLSGSVTFSVAALGTGPLGYQWLKNDQPIPGATSPTFTLGAVTLADAGSYQVVVSNSSGAVTSGAALLTINLHGLASGTSLIDAQPGPTIHGAFTIEGGTPKQMLIRAVGPTLASFALTGFMADPRLSVVDANSNAVAANDDWGAATNAAQIAIAAAQAGAYPLENGSKDAAVLATFPPGTYRVFLQGTPATTGAVSLEIYEADAAPRLVYLSARGTIATGGGTFVQGFTVAAPADGRSYLIRGLGPALGSFTALPDPRLTVFSGATQLATNDDWAGDSALVSLASSVGATPLVATSRDAALNFAPVAAGAYTVQITGGDGEIGSVVVEIFEVDAQRATTVPIALVSRPEDLAIDAGQRAVFGAVSVGKPQPSYQWSKDGVPISGATHSTYAIPMAQVDDTGEYSVRVGSAATPASTASASLIVNPANNAVHAAIGPGYVEGGTVTVVNTLHYAGVATQLGWTVTLPAGWSHASGSGTLGEVSPAPKATGTIAWAWSSPPPSPVTFAYTLNVPPGESSDRSLSAVATVHGGGTPEFAPQPSPLVVSQILRHTADTNHDFKFSLTELLRVVELYNTRHGSIRTGAYAVDAGNLEDGFAPDPARLDTAVVILAKHHTADSNRDGKLSLPELLRVIELYNYRSGTVRTGQYHVLAGSEDGFATGP